MDDARVLIADDDDGLRELLCDVFAEAGARVFQADSGVELLRQLAESGPFDLIVTDVRMSWASGAQVLSMARLAGYETPFLVITAFDDPELRRSVEALGAPVLRKPLDLDVLLRVARGLLPPRPGRAGRPRRAEPPSAMADAFRPN